MWAILQIDIKKIHLFKKELDKKINSESEIYSPQLLIKTYGYNKLIEKKIPVLGNYVFCRNKKFDNIKIFNQLNFLIGFKSTIFGHVETQKEIIDFINHCKKCENKNGLLENNFLNFDSEKTYKFKSGVFANNIFKILTIQKNRLEILMGKLKINTNIKKTLAFPV
jgi:hypothetical protein